MSENNRHANQLVPSGEGIVSLVCAVVPRYNDLIGTHQRITGNRLIIPKELLPDYNQVKQLADRYAAGDYRHRSSEASSLKTFAQWTVDVQRKIRGQPPLKVFDSED